MGRYLETTDFTPNTDVQNKPCILSQQLLNTYVMTNCTTIVLPEPLRQRAKDYGINISALCRAAVAYEIEIVENEIGIAPSGKTNNPDCHTPTTEGHK